MSEWLEVGVELDRRDIPLFSKIVGELGAGGVEELPAKGSEFILTQPWEKPNREALPTRCRVRAWLSPEQRESAALALETAFPEEEVELNVVAEEDWEAMWKSHHHRIQITDTLAIAPPWEAQEGDLIIPPGNAFGIGDHPTTRACLEMIERVSGDLSDCLDVGCGSGILAIAAAREGLKAEGIDIDEDSVVAARENAELNRIEASFSTTSVQEFERPRDLVVANLYAEVLTWMAPHLVRLTGRHLLLAGIMESKADALIPHFTGELELAERRDVEGWTALHLERR